MANPGTPNLAPAGPAVRTLADDNFAQRIGIGMAVSIGVNFALFAGASLMAREPAVATDNVLKYVVVPSPTATPVAATPSPTPSAVPSPTPSAAKPTPVPSATPKPQPSVAPTPRPTPAVRRNVVKPTPAPRTVTTPPPAVRRPVVRPSTVVPTPPPRPITQPNVAVRQPTKPVVITQNTQAIKIDPTMATPPPSVVRQLSTYRPTNPNQLNKGSLSGTTLAQVSRRTAAASTSAAGSGSPGAAGAAGGARSAADVRRSSGSAGAAGAIGAGPAAMNPVVVAPTVESTISGSTRQLRTVSGTASRLSGMVGVVTLSAKASAASTSTFEVPSGGGSLRAGTVTARQGTAGGSGATAMSGTPTVITSGAEYSVSAPGAPSRGPIGVRGNRSQVIGSAVTALQSKGNSADVGAGVAVYGDAPGGSQKGAIGKKAVAAVGDSGQLSAVGGDGIGPVGNEGTGAGGAGRASGAGVKGGSGRGVQQGAGTGGGGVGGRVSGGTGEVYGVPNGVPGGAVKTNVAVNVTKAGEAQVDTKKVTIETKKIADNTTIETKGPKDLTFDEIDEVATDKAVTQSPARATSKPSWDPPNVKYSGVVEVRVTINADGSHSEEVTKNTGVGELDRYLKDFFSRWRWEPGKVDGKAVKTSKTVRFRIN